MAGSIRASGMDGKIEPSSENGLSKRSAADTFQVRSVSQQRLIKQIGTLSSEIMAEISTALAVVMKIDG